MKVVCVSKKIINQKNNNEMNYVYCIIKKRERLKTQQRVVDAEEEGRRVSGRRLVEGEVVSER